ncbi:hypothetical protein [Profundibacter sp.]
MDTNTILNLARAYCDHHGYALSTVATYSVGDGKFFKRLAEGGNCTLRIASRLLQWFSDNWDDDAIEWPEGIPRPPKSEQKQEVA